MPYLAHKLSFFSCPPFNSEFGGQGPVGVGVKFGLKWFIVWIDGIIRNILDYRVLKPWPCFGAARRYSGAARRSLHRGFYSDASMPRRAASRAPRHVVVGHQQKPVKEWVRKNPQVFQEVFINGNENKLSSVSFLQGVSAKKYSRFCFCTTD